MNKGIRLEKVVSHRIDGEMEVSYQIVEGIGVRIVQFTLEELERLAALINRMLEEEKGGER